MDEEWEDELLRAAEELEAEIRIGVPQATFRATIQGERIQLISANRGLIHSDSPLGTGLEGVERAGVTIADLFDSGDEDSDRELTVTFLAEGDPGAEETLTEWAALVGYRRIWFPDRVAEVGEGPGLSRRAAVDCPSCRHHWSGGRRDFWLEVARRRAFPVMCLICGSDLPQWKLVPRPSYRTDCPPHFIPKEEQ